MKYVPKPIDTSHIQLSEEISKLTEVLAKNTHELWGEQRIKDGWVYGPERNDSKKEHPGLVNYEELSDSEKEYDRITAMNTIKTIVALGFTLNKK